MENANGVEVRELSERLERSLNVDDEYQLEKYHRLIADGKKVAKEGNLQKALELFKQAHNIHQTPKLESRINKIEELLAQNDDDEEEADEFVEVKNSGLLLFSELYDKLYDYQRDGVSFLYTLYRDGLKGGILADDMGLGKTIQVISFLSGMYDSEQVKHTLLVMPTSLITNWVKEFAKWTPGMRVKEFHGTSKPERTRNLEKVQRRSGVIITTYTMLMNNWQQLSSFQGKEFIWDYVILDEAHKIKNTSTKTAKSAYAIPSKNRILLTGTPVQNNLREMWTLFDFACQGALLGTAKTFKTEYENPITRAREKDATPGEKALGSRMSENLMTLIKPYFLRRTKSEVQKTVQSQKESADNEDIKVQKNPVNSGAVMPKLTRKNDLIVWTYLSRIQEDIYKQFISLDHIKELLLTTRSPLAELNILKKLCDHPRLLSPGAISKLGLEANGASDSQGESTESDINTIANIPDDTLISESGKLVFLLALLERLREEGHRTLVFAHYRKVLDIIQRILGNRGFKVLRLDGTITQIAERERLISLFQKDQSYSVFLLTTQVGGVGITLTAADRVVIYDPSWNPATDAQAVDRAYRIGQRKNVIIYRLITCGTVEEKIYRRQVFKDSLIRQNTGDKKNPFRYFSKQELRELFTLEDTRSSTTQLQLQTMHSRHRRTDPELDEHIAHLHTMEMFGISDHDLMFSLDANHDEDLESQEEQHYIESRVQKAQELMIAESELKMQLADSMASSTEPAWLRQPPESNNREKKPKDLKTSPPFAYNVNVPPDVVNLDMSSCEENVHQNQSSSCIDLTEETSPQKDFVPVDTAAEEISVGELIDKSGTAQAAESPEHEDSLLHNAPGNFHEKFNGSFHSEMGLSLISPSVDRRLSVPQHSNISSKTELSRASCDQELFHGNFNLQLEDSEADGETEEEEQKLISKLQMNGSFDINKSLSEDLHRQTDTSFEPPDLNESVVVSKKKKRAAVIYDSEEEEADEPKRDQFNNSFEVLGTSTPKSATSGSPRRRSRKSLAGNASVASHRSLIQSIIEDMDEQEEDKGSGDSAGSAKEGEDDVLFLSCDESMPEENMKEGKSEHAESLENASSILEDKNTMESEDDGSELYSDEEKEDIGLSDDHLQLEQTREESASITSSEDMSSIVKNKETEEKQKQDMSISLEESTGEPELDSGERMDMCTVNGREELSVQSESYESLVTRGKECYSQAKLDDALQFFLRAIDIKPGDPEVQFLTIQLYRKLSQR